MKKFRMLAALALCAVLLVSLVPAARAAQDGGQLQFDENGEFRILIVADTQDIDKPQKETIALLEAELDAAQPDLVVFLGDQIHGHKARRPSVSWISLPAPGSVCSRIEKISGVMTYLPNTA